MLEFLSTYIFNFSLPKEKLQKNSQPDLDLDEF